MANTPTVPTMKEVAREAGVSLGTVSKVVNGLPVGENYRIRVEAAIEKLDYRVNSYAKGLRSGRSATIAVILPNLTNPYFCLLADGINRALAARRHQMLLFSTDYCPAGEYLRMARQQKVDGVICLSYDPELQPGGEIPFVSIDRAFGPRIPCVSSDNYGGGWLAAQKLAELGCKRVAMLAIGTSIQNEPAKRRDGFSAACEALGLPCEMKLLTDGDDYQGFETFLAEHIRDGVPEFDGLFCGTDALAHRVLGTLQTLGVKVPEQVQLIGFDGCRAFGDLELTCSTVVQPVREIATTCVGMVLHETDHLLPSLICLPVRFAPGGTTK